MSNLYQSSTGVTHVTADGQPVGLVLDKSRGAVLGDELVTNGTFDTDSDWGMDSNWTIENGKATSTGLGRMFQSIPFLEANKITTQVTFDITELTQGGVVVNLYGSISEIFTSVGTHTFIARSSDNTNLYFNNAGEGFGFIGSIDNVSVKQILGNHGTQPVATKRPTYNDNPDRLTLDLVDDGLLVTIPTGGWDGYMVLGTDQGTASYGVSLPEGDYELGGDYFPGNTINQVLFREGDVHPIDLKTVEQRFVNDGAKASYGDVLDFTSYWREKNITEFPLIDTSSGINFNFAWLNNNLTSFPLIDTLNGTNFSFAWQGNDLTSFPLIDTSSATTFLNAWLGNNLTSFPLLDASSVTSFQGAWVDNNLTSFPLIDTSNGTTFYASWQNNNLTSFPLINTSNGTNFGYAWFGNNLTSFPLIDTSSGTNFTQSWLGNNLTSFPLIDTSSGTTFYQAWQGNNLTSFPLIDTSSGTSLFQSWYQNNLTSFPLIDTSSVTSFYGAWAINNLTSFPSINTSSGTNFQIAWYRNNLTSFPLIDTSSGTNFAYAWYINSNLTDFPANMFDNCLATNFALAFGSTNLSQASIDGILVSIESNGTSNGTFDQSGGSAPSSVGEAAIDRLYTRGWDVTVTGGYQGKFLPELLFENNENGFWYSPEIGE